MLSVLAIAVTAGFLLWAIVVGQALDDLLQEIELNLSEAASKPYPVPQGLTRRRRLPHIEANLSDKPNPEQKRQERRR